MKKRLKVTVVLLLAVFVSALVFPISATADTGPKDALTVTVENPPSEPYYLDLLTHGRSANPYSNLNRNSDTLDQDMLQLLFSKAAEGWWPAYAGGTDAPIWGSLTGKESGGNMVHKFSYLGVPKTYRIIIVTKSGRVTVSEPRTRQNLQSSVSYDYNTREFYETPFWLSLTIQFVATLFPTLVIEGLLLLLFGFNLKDNYRVFLVMNLITQVVLTLTTGTVLIKFGVLAAILVLLFVEFLILIAETIVYVKRLKGKTEGRRIGYGVTANIASLIFGMILVALTGI